MHESTGRQLLTEIPDDALVLDIGGWAQPFNRADHVVDLLPYETRGSFGSIGDGPERFTAETWTIADVNVRLPFNDGQFDYVICSHTLEDIRDPLTLCAEMQRVARGGYIETPSRLIESTWGIEGRYAGYYHHRWLVEITDDAIAFRHKPHSIHGSRRFHLPKSALRSMTDADTATSLRWSRSFGYAEVTEIDRGDVEADMAAFRERHAGKVGLAAKAMENPRDALRIATRAMRRH